MDFVKLLCEFVKTWISSYYMDLLKVVLYVSCSLSNKSMLKFDQKFEAFWSFCFELKVLYESRYSMPWVRYAFGDVFNLRWSQIVIAEVDTFWNVTNTAATLLECRPHNGHCSVSTRSQSSKCTVDFCGGYEWSILNCNCSIMSGPKDFEHWKYTGTGSSAISCCI